MKESDPKKMAAIHAEALRLAGDDGEQTVFLDAKAFLDGNEDEGSIGCNLMEHPGMDEFRRVVHAVVARPDVKHALARVGEIMDPPDWVFTDSIYLCTSAPSAHVAKWFETLQPDECGDVPPQDLRELPKPPSGMRWVCVWWD